MGRTTIRVVPRAALPIAKLRLGSSPGPQFNDRVHPQIQMIGRNVGPIIPQLLLTQSMHFFQIMKVLLDSCSIGNGLQNRLYGRFDIGAEECPPAVILADDNHANQPADGSIRRRKRLKGLGDFLAIQDKLPRLPPALMSGPLSQADRLLAVLPFAAAPLGLAGAWFVRNTR